MSGYGYYDEASWPLPPYMKFQATQAQRLFFIVWNPISPKPPTVRFESRAQAEAVAEKMAKRFGEPFYVLEAKALFERQTTPVKKTTLG